VIGGHAISPRSWLQARAKACTVFSGSGLPASGLTYRARAAVAWCGIDARFTALTWFNAAPPLDGDLSRHARDTADLAPQAGRQKVPHQGIDQRTPTGILTLSMAPRRTSTPAESAENPS
jgi:hypothetical protein